MNEIAAIIVAEGSLARLKELMRSLEAEGMQGRVLPPSDGCLNR